MSRLLKIAIAVVLALSLAVIVYSAVRLWNLTLSEEARTGLPVYYEVGEFAFTDSQGKLFTNKDLAGKVWVAEFFFTSCPGICPVMMTQMSRLVEAYKDYPEVHFVGFSVDPQTDTPERMAEYLTRYGGNPERWHLLTGPIELVQRLSEEDFKLGSVNTPAEHSSRFALVDQKGRIRGYYDGLDPASVDDLEAAIPALL